MKKACENWFTACLTCHYEKDPRKLKIPLQSTESTEFSEKWQIDHQKICMTESGSNKVLVMIDYFTKCAKASAEEGCYLLINSWKTRHGSPMTSQLVNSTTFVGSHVAQAHSTTYHIQSNGLVEKQKRNLVSILRVYCSGYITEFERSLLQMTALYNNTQPSTTSISPLMVQTGH